MALVKANTPLVNTLVKGIEGKTHIWDFGANPHQLLFAYAGATNGATAVAEVAPYTGTFTELDVANQSHYRDAIEKAFAALSAYVDVKFASTATYADADVKLAGLDNFKDQNGGVLYGAGQFPGTNADGVSATDFEAYLWLNTTDADMDKTADKGGGNFLLTTAIHEIGHVLGLAHPHDTANGSTKWSLESRTAAENVLDNERYTVMSYESGGLNVDIPGSSGHAVTPMAIDVAALQHMYGAKNNVNTSNTTYTITDKGTTVLDVNGSDGSVSIGAAWYCIWDSGGTDTIAYDGNDRAIINLNNATLNQDALSDDAATKAWIAQFKATDVFSDLPQELRNDVLPQWHAGGFFSRTFNDAGEIVLGGYSIANGASNIIENATGDGGDDILIGNISDNMLTGKGGDDLLFGSGGIDTAVYSEGVLNYCWEKNKDGSITVEHMFGSQADGADTLFGVEKGKFGGTTIDFNQSFVGVSLASPDVTANDMKSFLLADDPGGLSITACTFSGDESAATLLCEMDLGKNVSIGHSVFLTTGVGLPPSKNTQNNYGTGNAAGGDPDLTATAKAAFPGAGSTYDAAIINLTVDVTDAAANFVVFDVIFGSDEYPEYVNSSYVDIAAVYVNGVNYALFNNNPLQPLSIVQPNLSAGNFINNGGGALSIEYDGISPKLTIMAPVNFGSNTIKVGIADTGDDIYDSGLWIGNLQAVTGGGGGVFVPIKGNDSNNTFLGDASPEFYDLGAGNDIASTGGGSDVAFGRAGNDKLDGGAGNDSLDGGDDNDTLTGGAGNDALAGGSGNDILSGGAGNDTLTGGTGNDTLTGGAGVDNVSGGAGDDIIKIGGTEAEFDAINGGADIDKIMVAGLGAVTLDKFDAGTSSIEVWQGNGKGVTGNAGDNTLDFSDLVTASNLGPIKGGAGNDTLIGSGGNDTLTGGAGNDTLTGGAGADKFRMDSINDKGDILTDFNGADGDKLVFVALGLPGATAGVVRLVTGSDPDPLVNKGTFLFDTDNGELYWDSDGTGVIHAPVLLMDLNVTTLAQTDIQLI